jgi:anti-sigma factor ChrR (cupin superfamily)
MQLNDDFSRVVVVNTPETPWQSSPSSGVMLRMLEQGGLEGARTTSIVRYEPGAHLRSDSLKPGEEIIVLEGEFSDESGVYPAGTYIKNPPGSNHTPLSENGCILFIKQGHLQRDDLERVVVDVQNSEWRQGMVSGLSVLPLSEFKGEHSALVRWQPGTVFNPHRHWGGEEIYVLEGVFADEFGRYPAGTWLRNPHMSQHAPFSKEGCTIFVKVGHLPEVASMTTTEKTD